MAVLLHRLGHHAYHHRKLVLGIWLAVLAALVTCVGLFGGKLDDRFSVPGTESQRALDTLRSTLPQVSGANAQIVLTSPKGHHVSETPYTTAIRPGTRSIGSRKPAAAASQNRRSYRAWNRTTLSRRKSASV